MPNQPEPDLYLVLGVTPDASPDEVHGAWKRQLLFWHPDKGNRPEALARTQLINHAHEVLSDAGRRAKYDRSWRPSSDVDWSSTSSPNGGAASAASAVPDDPMPPWTPPPGTYKRKPRGARVPSPRSKPPGPTPYASAASVEAVPFDEFRSRLVDLMWKAQKMRTRAEQVAWGTQVRALLDDALWGHEYRHQFELAMIPSKSEGIGGAYAVLQALLEDADRGHLRRAGHAYGSAVAVSPPGSPSPVQGTPIQPVGHSRPPVSRLGAEPASGVFRRTVDWYLRPLRRPGGAASFILAASPRLVSIVFAGVLLTAIFPSLSGIVIVLLVVLAALCGIAAAMR